MRWTNFVAIAGVSLWATVAAAEYNPLAVNENERDAAALGQRLGIGAAVLEGPAEVEVLTHQELTLVYTAGKAEIAPGGGIRIGLRHVVQWTRPQTEKPEAEGYTTARTSNGARAVVAVKFGGKGIFGQYHPWQNIIEITFPERGLEEGDCLRVTFGDRSGGSPGIRVQPFDEFPFTFKLYVDPLGDGRYLPFTENPTVDVVAAQPFRLGTVMPTDAVRGEPTWCIVRAEDRYGNPAVDYRGTVELRATDPRAGLPPAHKFSEADRGVYRFENVVFNSPGVQNITAADGAFERTGNPVQVVDSQPEKLLLWGDLHGHTLHSDGRGTVEQFYDFAERVAGLDFCAVTDHAFEILDEMWEHSKKVTNAVNKPGRFVTFQAYEWSGMMAVGGDHNVFFLEDDPPLYRSRSFYDYLNFQMYHGPKPQVNHIEDLFITLVDLQKDRDVLCIPHWGGRHANPNWHNAKVQRTIEVFSEHQRSEEWMNTFLEKGYRLGIIASTDGHYGNPGYGYLKPTYDWDTQEIGMAAVAVYAGARTRESIFRALYDRHVYATSGDRIVLDVRADGHVMGSEFSSRTAPTIAIEAIGTATISLVEIKKDSQVVQTFRPGRQQVGLNWKDPEFAPNRACYYYVRILQENKEEAISSPIWVN